jgi:formate hydrogenlyase subunit 6/NADH:ubiquinone oxidoreductase subunit I
LSIKEFTEDDVAYKINTDKCLQCGLCVTQCPEKAIVVDEKVAEPDGLILYTTRVDQDRCTECGVCHSHEWWCPAKAIYNI